MAGTPEADPASNSAMVPTAGQWLPTLLWPEYKHVATNSVMRLGRILHVGSALVAVVFLGIVALGTYLALKQGWQRADTLSIAGFSFCAIVILAVGRGLRLILSRE